MGTPKVLNLDELELDKSDVVITHNGENHHMRILTVDAFIAQQKRQLEHEKRIADGEEEDGLTTAVEIMKTSISEFFPSLPVGELSTPKMFTIFAWLNELSSKINEAASSDVIEETADEEGNAVEGTE